jgi:hypothetical protein
MANLAAVVLPGAAMSYLTETKADSTVVGVPDSTVEAAVHFDSDPAVAVATHARPNVSSSTPQVLMAVPIYALAMTQQWLC